MEDQYLLLRWGSLMGWNIDKDSAAFKALKKWHELGVLMSAVMQRDTMSAVVQGDTDEQKNLICRVIDVFEGPIINDLSGEMYTKDQAKEYIMGYGKPRVQPQPS